MEPITPLEKVESSQIRAIGYTQPPSSMVGDLIILFNSGSMYWYPLIVPDIWQGLKAAPSKGRFFGEVIKDIPFIKLTNPDGVRTRPCPCGSSRALGDDYGACPKFEVGATGRCVYCDHSEACHARDQFNEFYNGPLTIGQRAEFAKRNRPKKEDKF